MTKIINVFDFINLGPTYQSDKYSSDLYEKYTNEVEKLYGISFSYTKYKMININFNSSIGRKTINVISIIRDLMTKEMRKILDSVNTIDISNENFNKDENLKKIKNLKYLLKIENSIMNNTEFNNISNICKNIKNLNDELYVFENFNKKFDEGIEQKKYLKIN